MRRGDRVLVSYRSEVEREGMGSVNVVNLEMKEDRMTRSRGVNNAWVSLAMVQLRDGQEA